MQNKSEGASSKAMPGSTSQSFSLLSVIQRYFGSGGSAGSQKKVPHSTAATGSFPPASTATATASKTSTASNGAKQLNRGAGACASANTSMSTNGGLKLPAPLIQTTSSYLNAKDTARLSITAGQMRFLLQHRPAIPMGNAN